MIVFPHIKINIGLNVVSRREDGYHDIESFMYPVKGLADILEIVFPTNSTNNVSFQTTGIGCGVEPEKNICVRAINLLSTVRQLPPIAMHLHKIVPNGAGLGGGSADCAFVLKHVNSLLNLGLSSDELRSLATQLGADCPFFIDDTPAIARGIGEVLTPFDVPQLVGKKIVIAKPDVSVSTAEAYAAITPAKPSVEIEEVLQSDIRSWKSKLRNDFEEGIFARLPELEFLRNRMYGFGALYAQMSGSGSAVYGIFDGDVELPDNSKFGDMFVWKGTL